MLLLGRKNAWGDPIETLVRAIFLLSRGMKKRRTLASEHPCLNSEIVEMIFLAEVRMHSVAEAIFALSLAVLKGSPSLAVTARAPVFTPMHPDDCEAGEAALLSAELWCPI
jgi:hypothetical protein